MTSAPEVGELRRTHFIPAFDGLRGFGALIVYFNHAGMSRLLPFGAPTAVGFLTNGGFAVDLFFTLSGYVMAMVASRSRESLIAITLRRYLRLALPAAASCLLSAALLAAALYFNRQLAALNHSAWLDSWFQFPASFAAALREGLIGIFQLPDSAYNSSLWTLYYELWCSFAIFIGAYLGRAWWLPLVAAALAMRYFDAGDLAAPACFTVGAFAYRIKATSERRPNDTPPGSRRLTGIGATIAIVFALFLATYPRFPSASVLSFYAWLPAAAVDTWAPAAAGALIVTVIRWSPLFSRLFSTRVMLFFGRYSFPIYLVHLPILCSLGSWLGVVFYAHLASSSWIEVKLTLLLIFAVMTGAVLLVAVAFSRLVDEPSLYLGRRLSSAFDRRFGGRTPASAALAANAEPLHLKD